MNNLQTFWNKYKELAIFLLLISLFVQNCQNKVNEKSLNGHLETAIKLNNLTTSRNYKEKELKKLENKLKHYEDSLQSTKNYIDILIANPNRKQLDSLRARYNPKSADNIHFKARD